MQRSNTYYFVVCLLIFIFAIPYFSMVALGQVFTGRMMQLIVYSSIVFFFFSNPSKNIPLYGWVYAVLLFMSSFIHQHNPQYEKPFFDALRWTFLLFLFFYSQKYYKGKLLFYAIVAFYVLNCLIGCYEKLTLTHPIEYPPFLFENFQNENVDNLNFRALGLVFHPLYNANFTSMVLALILISDNLNKFIKVGLSLLGVAALLSFNSRGAMMLSGVAIAYFLLQRYRFSLVFLVVIIVLFFSQTITTALLNSEILGRLSEDLNDDSSQTRLICYYIFFNQDWSLEHILGGVGYIRYPGMEYTLENGILLTLGFWGWIAGGYKVYAELMATYRSLQKRYDLPKIIVFFIMSWGVAFCNNNSFNYMFFVFIATTITAFVGFDRSKESRKKKKAAHSMKHSLQKHSRQVQIDVQAQA